MTAAVSRPAIGQATPNPTAPDATSTRPTTSKAIPMSATSGGLASPAASVSTTSTPLSPQGTLMISRPALRDSTPNDVTPDATSTRPTRPHSVPRVDSSGEPTSPAANSQSDSRRAAPQGTKSTGRHVRSATHQGAVAGSSVPDLAAGLQTAPMGVSPLDPAPRGQGAEHPSTPSSASLLDPALCLAADILDDLERVRIANENRLRQLTRVGVDKDGEERGFGLDESHPDVARLAAMVATLKAVEHDATLELQRKLRKHPLGAWVKSQRGVGEKQGARLLAAIGDPYINSAKGAPRTVSALWAYCGLHVLRDTDHLQSDDQRNGVGVADGGNPGQNAGDAHVHPAGVAAKRRKGERANWSTKAKMRAYLIAESCIKQLGPDCRDGHVSRDTQSVPAVPAPDGAGRDSQRSGGTHTSAAAAACACSPYRVKYDARRAHTAVTHPDWTDGHSHNDALRIASKEILKDLWRAARDWHQERVA